VRLQLSVLAYNLGNLWRRLVLPKRIDRWALTSLQQRLVKTGCRSVKHARYYWLLLAEGQLGRFQHRQVVEVGGDLVVLGAVKAFEHRQGAPVKLLGLLALSDSVEGAGQGGAVSGRIPVILSQGETAEAERLYRRSLV